MNRDDPALSPHATQSPQTPCLEFPAAPCAHSEGKGEESIRQCFGTVLAFPNDLLSAVGTESSCTRCRCSPVFNNPASQSISATPERFISLKTRYPGLLFPLGLLLSPRAWSSSKFHPAGSVQHRSLGVFALRNEPGKDIPAWGGLEGEGEALSGYPHGSSLQWD